MDRRDVILRKHIIPAAHAFGLQGTVEDDLIKRAVDGAWKLPQIRNQAATKGMAARAISIVEKLSLRDGRRRALARGRWVVRLIGGQWWLRSHATVEAKGDNAPLVAILVRGAIRWIRQE